MCGIAGAFAICAGGAVDRGRVQRMTRHLAHRGPDAEGFWKSERSGACFGHRRLSIIDPDAGAQPMTDETGRFVLVFNGEIYNYRELRLELERDGIRFRTESDTEVLLRLLQREGAGGLDRVTGMFAFGFWDDERAELLLARDRIGEKPLFYALDGGCVYFASSFAALRRTSPAPLQIDPEALDAFLTLGYVPAPQTIDAAIRKLPAGTLLRADGSGVRVERYWRVGEGIVPFQGTRAEATDRLDALVQDAVRLRLRSDVPLGVFLSGGVDSSLMAAVAARQSPHQILTFSIGFDETGYDESAYAAAVAREIGSEHHLFRSRLGMVELLPEMVAHYGELFGDPSALPVWLLARETRRHVTVAIGGDGGDEGFGGYNWYRTASRLQRLKRFVPSAVAAAGHRVLRNVSGPAAVGRVSRLAGLLSMSDSDRFAALRSFVGRDEARRLYAGTLIDAHRTALAGPGGRLADIFHESGGSELKRMQVVDIETYLADCLMPKVDVATMAHGLEARAPLLDHDLLRFALSLPDEWLVDGESRKAILKDVLYRYLPASLFERPKQGFSVPLERWFTDGLRHRVEALPGSAPLLDTGWLRPQGIHDLVEEHNSGRRDNSQRLYNFIVLDEWLRQA